MSRQEPVGHYEVLGLPATASQAEVQRRFEELSRLYQIDPSASAPREGMAALIVEAHRVLANAALRAHYDAGLAGGVGAREGETGRRGEEETGSETGGAPASASVSPAVVAPVTPYAPPRPPVQPAAATAAPADKQVAAELLRRGISQAEITRLVGTGRSVPATDLPKRRTGVSLAPVPEVPPSRAYEPKPTIELPPFREALPQDRAEADRRMTAANIARRRGDYRAAEQNCRSALELAPADAAGLELYGDVLQSVGRVDDALYCYHRATEADANRKTAEKKYAELMLRQNREIALLQDEFIPRSTTLAVTMALVPGGGQAYNGAWFKAILCFGIVLGCILLLMYSSLGFPGQHGRLSTSLVTLMAIGALTYVVGIVDAWTGARRGHRRGGWDV